uniref:Cullin domain-containing protein n=1 Tax=Panagrellus redivivus TaxID=6233 RepID=A0A7E4UX29_PANRE
MSGSKLKKPVDLCGFPILTVEEELTYVNGHWDTLKKGITYLLTSNKRNVSYESLYTDTYIIIRQKHGDMLYENVIETVTNHLKTNVRPILETTTKEKAIDELIKCYDAYTIAMADVCEVLMYMDKVYVPSRKLESVKDFELRLFREEIVNYGPIKEKLKATMVDLRQKEPVDGASFKQVFEMLTALGVEKEFEATLIVYTE